MSGKRAIRAALKKINAELLVQAEAHRANTRPGAPNYGAGLSREGYVGGYMDALNDVLLAMNGVMPNRRGWWVAPNRQRNEEKS